MPDRATIHASAVLIGAKAVLIRGPSGSGKSKLAWDLIEAGVRGALPFARLVGDDRVYVEASNGSLLVRAADNLAGLLEVRGVGIRQLPHEPVAVAGLVIDLAAGDAARLPEGAHTTIDGVRLPRLAVAAGASPLPLVLASLGTRQTTG
jgi:hypothetical protein